MPVLFGVTYKSQKMYIKNTDLVENLFTSCSHIGFRKKANILQYPLCFPCEMTSQERAQIFYIDDVSLPGSG